MTKGLQRSSKIKETKVIWQIPEKKTKQIDEKYKHRKTLFDPTKKKSKTLYYSKLIKKYKNNTKKRGILWKKY